MVGNSITSAPSSSSAAARSPPWPRARVITMRLPASTVDLVEDLARSRLEQLPSEFLAEAHALSCRTRGVLPDQPRAVGRGHDGDQIEPVAVDAAIRADGN